MYKFLEAIDPTVVKSYAMERYANGENKQHDFPKPERKELVIPKAPTFKKKTLDLPSIKSLSDGHIAKDYVIFRKIPKSFHTELFYAEDFRKFCEYMKLPPEKTENLPHDDRLIIPFVDIYGDLVAFQGRDLHGGPIRYITLKLKYDTFKVYGIDRANVNEMVYVVEGPIDSMFLPNCVAMADSNLMSAENITSKSNLVLVYVK
jgi:hypothetical protein